MIQIRIPGTITEPAEFIALQVRLRLLGMPAEIIPDTLTELRGSLVTAMSDVRSWLYRNGYWVRGMDYASHVIVIEQSRYAWEPEYKTYPPAKTQALYSLTSQRVKGWIV